jgi:hypothetical protein
MPTLCGGKTLQGWRTRKHNSGILIYVSELCNSAVSVRMAVEDGTRLWLKFTDLGNSKPLFLCITYVPPQNSPYTDKALYDRIVQEIVEAECRNPSFGLATKAKGLQGCGPKGSPGVTSGTPGSVGK